MYHLPKTEGRIRIKVEPQKPSEPAKETESTKASEDKEKSKEVSAAEAAKPAEEKKPVQNAYTELQLCFVEIDADGSINRKIVKRKVAKNDSPLTTAIKAVIAGPDTTTSEERNCISVYHLPKTEGRIRKKKYVDKYPESGIIITEDEIELFKKYGGDYENL